MLLLWEISGRIPADIGSEERHWFCTTAAVGASLLDIGLRSRLIYL